MKRWIVKYLSNLDFNINNIRFIETARFTTELSKVFNLPRDIAEEYVADWLYAKYLEEMKPIIDIVETTSIEFSKHYVLMKNGKELTAEKIHDEVSKKYPKKFILYRVQQYIKHYIEDKVECPKSYETKRSRW